MPARPLCQELLQVADSLLNAVEIQLQKAETCFTLPGCDSSIGRQQVIETDVVDHLGGREELLRLAAGYPFPAKLRPRLQFASPFLHCLQALKMKTQGSCHLCSAWFFFFNRIR